MPKEWLQGHEGAWRALLSIASDSSFKKIKTSEEREDKF
jgi:hypothetical protein